MAGFGGAHRDTAAATQRGNANKENALIWRQSPRHGKSCCRTRRPVLRTSTSQHWQLVSCATGTDHTGRPDPLGEVWAQSSASAPPQASLLTRTRPLAAAPRPSKGQAWAMKPAPTPKGHVLRSAARPGGKLSGAVPVFQVRADVPRYGLCASWLALTRDVTRLREVNTDLPAWEAPWLTDHLTCRMCGGRVSLEPPGQRPGGITESPNP